MKKGTRRKNKKAKFDKIIGMGRQEFARAKRKIGLNRGQATNHQEIIKKLK
jgi:hypothetical protein